MENNEFLKTGNIKFDILENGSVQISIECSEIKYFELLGILEHIKTELINDNKNK